MSDYSQKKRINRWKWKFSIFVKILQLSIKKEISKNLTSKRVYVKIYENCKYNKKSFTLFYVKKNNIKKIEFCKKLLKKIYLKKYNI